MHQSGITGEITARNSSGRSTASAGEHTVALVGFPNSGKTTLFNLLTGLNYVTVNYPGATVNYSTGKIKGQKGSKVIDTPGVGSLLAFSPEEKVTIDCLLTTKPEQVIVVVDANQLTRHLYLFDQIRYLGVNPLVVVTMLDVANNNGKEIDLEKLAIFLECPVIGLDPRRNKDLVPLLKFITAQKKENRGSISVSLNILQKHYTKDTIQRIFESLDVVEKMVLKKADNKSSKQFSWDSLLLDPFWGVFSFVAIMVFIFTSIFWLATPFMNGIDTAFAWVMNALHGALPQSWIADFFIDGLIAGIGAVAIFLPQIVILFLFMGILEDTGYLARGAAIIDKPLKKIGLNGKSFVPLLSGYACAIPAMMAARTIKSPLERKLTLLIIPLMSCSARLPVYVLLIGFVTPPDKPLLAGIWLAGMYFGGFVLGAIVSTIVYKFIKHHDTSSFIQEIPPIRRPLAKIVLITTYNKAKEYFVKAGPTILVISALLWVFTHTPAIGRKIDPVISPNGTEYVSVSNSLAAQMGQWIEPVTRPLGLDWRGGVALMSGFAAREVFVASMAMIYRLDDMQQAKGLNKRLISRMNEITFLGTGEKVFTVSTVLGLLLFYMIALQCFPTVAVAKREFGSTKLAMAQLAFYTGGAYILTLILVQGLRAFGVA